MLMRSKLFVPGSRPELFAKAAASKADALSFDLEDAVAESRKEEARTALAGFLSREGGLDGKVVVVRVNAVGTAHFEADMHAVVGPRLDLVNLPMIEDPETIVAAAALLETLDAQSGRASPTGILVNIETARGVRRAAELACAHPRVAALQIGYGDLLEPLGIDRRDEAALSHIRVTVRLAAGEAGVPAYDSAFAAVNDPEGYRAECLAARRQGFAGKSCIHPTQIDTANETFLPSPAEIERARRMVAAAEEAEAKGVGAYLVDGEMVDAPFLIRARAILALAERQAQHVEA